MAKIPAGEGFGEVVARPTRLNEARVPRAAFGGALAGAAVEGAQQLRANIGEEQQRQEAARREQERRAEAERAKAASVREAADRARAAVGVNAIDADLDVITDEVAEGVRAGKIPREQATEEFKRRTQERVTAGLADIPTEHQAIAQAGVNNRITRLSRTVTKAVTARDQSDVRAGIDTQLEVAQRLYMTDPAKADAMVATTIETLGPQSGLDPAQLGKLQQGWRENTRATKAQTLVTAARRDNKALDAVAAQLNSDEFADMDPARKGALLAQVEGYSVANAQRAEVEARRRQAEGERYLRNAEAEFNAAQSLVTQGKVLSPEYVERVSKATAGTPYGQAFRESIKQGPANSAFGVLPLAVQERQLRDLRGQLNTQGTNPGTEKRVAELERIHEQSRRDYAEDPLLAAQERGVLPTVAPLNTTDVSALVGTIGQRVQQAQVVATQTGAPVSPLLRSEAEQVGKLINILPIEQRAGAIAQIAAAVGPQQAAALARQVGPKDKALGLALGLASSKTTNGRYTSELVLRGAQAIKDRSIKTDNTAGSGIRAQVAAEIGDAVVGDAREDLIEAAVLTYYGRASEGRDSVREAVALATGGIGERGGRKIVLPYGIKADDFDKRLRAVTPAALAGQAPDGQVYVGGTAMALDAFTAQLPEAALVTVGNGRYHVRAGGSVVTNKDRRPIVLEVR